MKKTVLVLVSSFVFSFGGVNNYSVTIADIKDALYHLILDYKKLKKEVNINNANVNQKLIKTKEEIEKKLKNLQQSLHNLEISDNQKREKLKKSIRP